MEIILTSVYPLSEHELAHWPFLHYLSCIPLTHPHPSIHPTQTKIGSYSSPGRPGHNLTAVGTGVKGVRVSTTTSQNCPKKWQIALEKYWPNWLPFKTKKISLAMVVLQNRWGLDLLTTDKGGICTSVQEVCCFYTNRSDLVRDGIKKLRDQATKFHRYSSLWNMGLLSSLTIFFLVSPLPLSNSFYNYWSCPWVLPVLAIHFFFAEDHQCHYWWKGPKHAPASFH